MRDHFTAWPRVVARHATVLVLLASVFAGCESTTSLPSSPTPTPVSQVSTPPPAPVPVAPRWELIAARLSGVVTELTADGLLPIEGVELYCDACGEFGHTFTTTDAGGAYDFGSDGIWLYSGSPQTTVLVRKDGYHDPGGSAGPREWSQRYVTLNGDTRFDFTLVRR